MSVHELIGLCLESCRFSKSSYSLEFSGKKNNEFYSYLVSTSYNLTSVAAGRIDAMQGVSEILWKYLENELIDVIENEGADSITFKFGNGEIVIWGDEPLIDNLLLVTNNQNEEWFTVL